MTTMEALAHAIDRRQRGMVEMLLAYGADPSRPSCSVR